MLVIYISSTLIYYRAQLTLTHVVRGQIHLHVDDLTRFVARLRIRVHQPTQVVWGQVVVPLPLDDPALRLRAPDIGRLGLRLGERVQTQDGPVRPVLKGDVVAGTGALEVAVGGDAAVGEQEEEGAGRRLVEDHDGDGDDGGKKMIQLSE